MVETAFRETGTNTLNKQSQVEAKHQLADLARGGGGAGFSFPFRVLVPRTILPRTGASLFFLPLLSEKSVY